MPNLRRTPPAGRRPHLVQVLRATDVRNATTGEFVASYSPLDGASPSRWASVRPLSGRELQTAREVQADVTHQVEMPFDRRMAEATPKMVVSFGGRTLEILSVVDLDERNITLRFLCREAV